METHFAELANDRPVNDLEDLERNVYCVLGMPIDAIDMPSILHLIDAAAAGHAPFLISTPNLNFLVIGRSNPEFRETILDSDLCPADGMPVVWLAHLIGVPIKRRVSGSDIFQNLVDRQGQTLKVFLFGGAEGVGDAAARTLNGMPSGLSCVGTINPGFCSVEAMSRDDIIDKVNSSGADLLAVSLGAQKGQLWLHRNRKRLASAVRAHFGAAINFQAGVLKRAPPGLRAWGLEWLWRIKEEPHLWRRYAYDGYALLYLLVTHVLPLAVLYRWRKFRSERAPKGLLISIERCNAVVTAKLVGDANQRNVRKAIESFKKTLMEVDAHLVIDLRATRVIDPRFFGLLLMLRKGLKTRGAKLGFAGVSAKVRRLFLLNELQFLLEDAA